MTNQPAERDELKAAIIQGMQDAVISLLYTQGLGQAYGPVGQLARAMTAEAVALLETETLDAELPVCRLGDMATVRVATATAALAMSIAANEVVKQTMVNPVADARGRHDTVKAIAETADQVCEEGTTDDTLEVAMDQLRGFYQMGGEEKVVFQEQYNSENATHVEATVLTVFNPGAINLTALPAHGTYFRRWRMLAPYWTEWTEWVWSGGRELAVDRFNRPLRISGTDKLMTPKGRPGHG